jgi:hypothetical protein
MAERARRGMDKDRATVDQGSIAPPADPTGVSGPDRAPLSPTERERRMHGSEHSDHRMGTNMLDDPSDPQKRVSHEEPGTDAANPLPQALNPNPTPQDDR